MVDIIARFERKGRTWPNPRESTLWLLTEVGELAEEILMTQQKWVRNNPKKNDPGMFGRDTLADELADVMEMTMITGHLVGIDPLEVLRDRVK